MVRSALPASKGDSVEVDGAEQRTQPPQVSAQMTIRVASDQPGDALWDGGSCSRLRHPRFAPAGDRHRHRGKYRRIDRSIQNLPRPVLFSSAALGVQKYWALRHRGWLGHSRGCHLNIQPSLERSFIRTEHSSTPQSTALATLPLVTLTHPRLPTGPFLVHSRPVRHSPEIP